MLLFLCLWLGDSRDTDKKLYVYLILYLTQFCNLINKQKSFNPPIGLSENSRRSRKLLDFQSLKDEYVCTDYPTSPSSSTFESRICHVIFLRRYFKYTGVVVWHIFSYRFLLLQKHPPLFFYVFCCKFYWIDSINLGI